MNGRDAEAPKAWGDEKALQDISTTSVGSGEIDPRTALHKGLKARHVTMIAIGGAIGTGLIIGTNKALAQGGPASTLIAYTFIGAIVALVMAALGEMAAYLPLASGFTGYATRFCDPSLGFALGWTYWCKYIIVTPNQLTAVALVMQYWVPRERLNPGVFIAIFLVVIIILNYWGIKAFGEIEFWLSCFKVLTICAVIILTLILACGGGPNHDATGFRYWSNPGAFSPWEAKTHRTDAVGKFAGFWSTLVIATFAYGGTELVGVTIGEAQNPRRTIPKAIKLTFYRILVFYCLSVFLLGMVVPYTSAAKLSGSTAAASPFVLAIKLANIKGLDHVLNGCIMLFVFSAANSDLYTASRTLYGLATVGSAPAIFKRTNNAGVPVYSLGFCACFGLLAFMNVSTSSAQIFTYFVNLVSIFALETWISLLVTHICFVRARKVQGIPNSAMPFVAPLGATGSYIALGLCVLVALTKNFDAFVGGFSYKTFITGYIGIPIYLGLIFFHKLIVRPQRVRPEAADFITGKDAIDREEEEFLAAQAAQHAAHGTSKGVVVYDRFISWLF